MKKRIRLIAFAIALIGIGNIVLHSSHLDSGHALNTSHHCALCEVARTTSLPVVPVVQPVVVLVDALSAFHFIEHVFPLFSDHDSRGPPSLA